MADIPRLTSEQKKNLTLRQLFEYEAASKPSGDPKKPGVPGEVKRHLKQLEGIVDPKTNTPVLDMVVKDMDVGQVMGDIISDSPYKDADVTASGVRRSRSSLLITRLNTMFAGAGFGGSYVKNETSSYLTPDVFTKEAGWSFKRQRKTPTGFQDDIYVKLKQILADETLDKEVRLQMGAHVFGGFRPDNLSNFKIENYDRENGILTFYDPKSKKDKFLVVNPAVKGIVDEQIGDRTSGLIFPNAKSNQTKLNNVLKDRLDPVTFSKPDGSLSSENFTVYKLRNLNETILSDSGLNEGDINFLNGRASSTEAGGYVASSARKRRINNAANELVASIAGYSGTATVSQFASDIGVDFPDKALSTVISKDLLVDEDYLSALDPEFFESLPSESGTYSSIPLADPELTEQYKQETIATSQVRTQEQKQKALELEAQNLEKEQDLATLKAEAAAKNKPAASLKSRISPETADFLKRIGVDTAKAVPFLGLGFVGADYAEAKEQGLSDIEAAGKIALQETVLAPVDIAKTAIDVGEAVIESAGPPIQRSIEAAEEKAEESFLSGLTRGLTGGGLGLNIFNSGGFVTKN